MSYMLVLEVQIRHLTGNVELLLTSVESVYEGHVVKGF
jgi:hypothetical protein